MSVETGSTLIFVIKDAGLPIHALSLVLSCLTMSEQFHLSRPQLASYLRLAKVLLSFRIPQTALKVVQDVMPAVLASEIELQLKADAYLMMGKCLLECVNSRKYDGSLYTFTDCIEPFKSALKGTVQASQLYVRKLNLLSLSSLL